MSKWFWIVFTLITTLAYLLLFRQLANKQQWGLLIPILLLAAASAYGYYVLFTMGNVGVAYGILTGSLVLLMALAGVLFYHEHPTMISWLGLILIVLGVVLLAVPW